MEIGETKQATITLYDANENTVTRTGKAKFTFGKTRIMQWASANQRQLDEIIAMHPTVYVRATIDDAEFIVANGRSKAVF